MMPHVIAAVLIGAGIAAGMKWFAREVVRTADARAAQEQVVNGPLATVQKKQRALMWDADAGVYRPSEHDSI